MQECLKCLVETQIIQIKEYLKDYESKLGSVMALDSRAGSNELGCIFGNRKIFTNPKPTNLLAHLLSFIIGNNDVDRNG